MTGMVDLTTTGDAPPWTATAPLPAATQPEPLPTFRPTAA